MEKLQQRSLNLAFILALLTPLTALMSGVGVRYELWHFKVGFGILKYSVFAALLALVLTVIALGAAYIAHQKVFTKRAIYALVVSLVVSMTPILYLAEFRKIPTLADATTDFDLPPSFIDVGPQREGKNPSDYLGEEAAELQQHFFPELEGLVTGYTKKRLIGITEEVVTEMGMEIVASYPELGRLEATATSLWFGFKDDVVVRVLPYPGGNTVMDVRSASRVGRLDGGVNAKRVQALLARVQAKLPSR